LPKLEYLLVWDEAWFWGGFLLHPKNGVLGVFYGLTTPLPGYAFQATFNSEHWLADGHVPFIDPPFPIFYGKQQVFPIPTVWVFIQFIKVAGHPPPHVYLGEQDNGYCGANVPCIDDGPPYAKQYLCFTICVAANE